MTYLKITSTSNRLWDVKRGSVKVGEVALVLSPTAEIRFIPSPSFAYKPEELNSLSAFMEETFHGLGSVEDQLERARR
jgi:hypothetical protein